MYICYTTIINICDTILIHFNNKMINNVLYYIIFLKN